MPDRLAGGLPPVSIEFGSVEWKEEVERYDHRSPVRTQAQSARKTIETGTAKLDWKRCKADVRAPQDCPVLASSTYRSAERAPQMRPTDSCSS